MISPSTVGCGVLLVGAIGCGSSVPPITGRVAQETLASTIVHASYLILVRLPPAYDAHPTRIYPVVCQLDATSFGPEFDVTAGQAADLEACSLSANYGLFHSGGMLKLGHRCGRRRGLRVGWQCASPRAAKRSGSRAAPPVLSGTAAGVSGTLPPMPRHRTLPPPRQMSYKIRVIGAHSTWFRDVHHAFLSIPWWAGLGIIVAAFLFINVLFGIAYARLGGVANARPQSVADGFYFSIQTMATVGYGAMYPQSTAANVLVVIEAMLGLLITALSAGLVFAKFSRPTGRIMFSRAVVIGPMDGTPTLMFRVGNERRNIVAEATIRVAISRTVKTAEGVTFYRMTDLPLVRDRSPAMAHSWNVMHEITASSPLYGYDPERMANEDLELMVSLFGVDDTSYQPVYARHQYEHPSIIWGARLDDVLSEAPDGNMVLDIGNFHSVVPTQPSDSFPYPRPKSE